MGFIEGFIAETRARKLKAVLQDLVADPSLISADMVEDVHQVQTPRRGRGGACG